MNVEFPHLDDTNFPGVANEDNLSGVDVYKYQNDFDYYRWKGQISIKLLNVLWNSDYADVPYFDNDKKRDEWFDKQDGIIQPLLSPFNSTPETFIQVPIPYNDAFKYNYVVVDMPMQTSENQPIDYEDSKTRVKRWYYFIEDMEQLSPNTTRFELNVDYWTTFIHSVEINYLMLERGHAPMTRISVDEYLNNPIMSNEYLLASDFNYGDKTIIQTSNYVPIGNGKKYVLFCAPYTKDDFSKFDGVKYSGHSTLPTYEDTEDRWGFQYKVNDYEWKYGNTDYSNADLPIYNGIQSGILNGCECFAIEGTHAQDFFNEMATYHVNFIHGIQAMFILDEELFYKTESFSFHGYTLYVADKQIRTDNFTFNKNQFGFDSKYKEITKLYTFPYSVLEITDDEGNNFEARIENCGRIQVHKEVSLVYPYLNYNIFFSGINGDGTMQYTWEPVYGGKHNKEMWASDFSKFMMNWEVPVYTIYVSSENEYAVNNAAGMHARRLAALTSYHNSVRNANTNRENMAASMATQTANVAASGQTNTNNVAASGATNSANTGIQNTANTNITDRNNTALRNNTDTAMEQNLAITKANNTKIDGDYHTDNDATAVLTTITNDVLALSTAVNQAASIVSGVTGGIASGNALSIVNVGIDAAAVGATTSIAMSNNKAVSTITQTANRDKGERAKDTNTALSTFVRRSMSLQADENIDTRSDNTTTQNTASQTITDNIVATNNANAVRTQNTNNANAVRTQNTETNNATYIRNATVLNEKGNLVQKQREAESEYKNARLRPPAKFSHYSGDFKQDIYMRRGIRMNIRTQSKSAIAQTGDAFLRFGYALHRIWDMKNGFNYMKYFTYWKAEDIWVNDGTGVANIATNIIRNILLNGVTVWNDPAKIGMVTIYENM